MKDIIYVLAVAECKSISRAAEILYISQPALSRYIGKLEQELGMALFERTSEGISLTQAGHIYVRYGREIMQLKENMDRELKTLYSDKIQSIHVAMTLNTVYMSMVEMQNTFTEKYPDCKLSFANIMSGDICSGLRNHLYNFAIGPDSLACSGDISYEKICEEYMLLMVPERWNLRQFAQKREGIRYPWLDLSEIPDLDIILQEETSAMRKEIDIMYEEYGMKATSKMVTVNSALAIQATEHQMGCCFISEAFFPYIMDKSKIQLYSIGKTVKRTNSCILYLKGKGFTKEERFCMSVIRQTLQDNYKRITA